MVHAICSDIAMPPFHTLNIAGEVDCIEAEYSGRVDPTDKFMRYGSVRIVTSTDGVDRRSPIFVIQRCHSEFSPAFGHHKFIAQFSEDGRALSPSSGQSW